MQNNTKTTLKIYWQTSAKYPWVLGLIIFSILLGTILETVAPLFYKNFFDLLASTENVAIIRSGLIHTLLIIMGVGLISWAFSRLSVFGANFLEAAVLRDLENYCFAVLHKHSFAFFNNNFVGSLTKKVNRFVRSFESTADRIFWEIFPLVISVVVILFVLFKRSIFLGLVLIGWIFIFFIINFLFIKFKLKYDIARSEIDSKVTGLLADTFTNNANVKLFCGLEREKKSFAGLNQKQYRLRRFVWDLSGAFHSIQGLLMIALEIGIFYLAIGLKQQGILTLGDFVLIQTYLVQMFMRLWNFGHIVQRIYEDLAEADEMSEVILKKPGIMDVPGAMELKISSGKIEFQNVSFAYHENKNLLSNFNFALKPDERLALVGPSGAGKTTVIKLLLRMYDITAGRILIDGQNIAEVKQISLWDNVSLVPQDPILFHRNLKENIRYGRPEASDEEVCAAAKMAHCDEFIKNLPQGYDTFVGERGVKLSGGERQRVAIARAILRGSPILVLDEATSSLDSESERLIQDALENLMRGKTVIVIAHRLSTIMKMDRIAVIEKGGIIEEGTHGELLQKENGIYKKLWEMQAGGFIK